MFNYKYHLLFKNTTFGNCKDQYSHMVCSSKCLKYQTCENLGSIGNRICKEMMKEKQPCCITLCAFMPMRNKKASVEVSMLNNNVYSTMG